jgi:hypothetical protein
LQSDGKAFFPAVAQFELVFNRCGFVVHRFSSPSTISENFHKAIKFFHGKSKELPARFFRGNL